MIQGKIDGILMDISRFFPVLVGDTSACEEIQLLTCDRYIPRTGVAWRIRVSMKDNKKKSKHKKSASGEAEILSEKKARSDAPHSDEIKRLNRVNGQVEGIQKMLESGRTLHEVLIQFKAVHSALRSIEQRIFRNTLEDCLNAIAVADKKKEKEERVNELLDLFKQSER